MLGLSLGHTLRHRGVGGGVVLREIATFGSVFNTWTTSITKASDEVLFVALGLEDSADTSITVATFDGDNLTQDANAEIDTGFENQSFLYRIANSKTSGDVIITANDSTDLSGRIFGVKGITGGPQGTVATATASSASSISDTFTAAAGLLINVLSNGGNDMLVEASNGETEFARVNGSSQSLHVSYKIVAAGSVTTGWQRVSGASTSPRLAQVSPVYALA